MPLARSQASVQVLANIPRFGIEALAIVLVATLAYHMALSSAGLNGAIPVLGALVLGAQRMLPLVQDIYLSLVTLRGNKQSTVDALDLLDQPMPSIAESASRETVPFSRSIRLRDLSFGYAPDAPLVLKELAKPRKTHLLTAGDFTRPAEEVSPGVLATLHAFKPDQGPVDRLDLARWIVAKDNPLTARVIANRVWQAYFGRGLVETENDFGSQGTSPSHPELLDWLAVEFVERGWSLKALHRTIVLTQTYRRDSANRADLIEKDPDNRLLARQTRLRLDAELVRDSALVASGLLTHKVGGPPVYPPIPDGVMSLGQVKRVWNTSQGPDRTRRGLYTFTYRVTPPPAFAVFDAPDGLSTCTRRNRSNTPLQALTLLNDPAYFEAAQALAKVIEKEGLATAFRRCTSRAPEASELAVLARLDRLSAARALLNLDETITRD